MNPQSEYRVVYWRHNYRAAYTIRAGSVGEAWVKFAGEFPEIKIDRIVKLRSIEECKPVKRAEVPELAPVPTRKYEKEGRGPNEAGVFPADWDDKE